jgi:hypothetical protein
MKGSEHLIKITPTLNIKQIQGIFNFTLKGVLDAIKILYVTAFYLKIKPVADRYNWTIKWGGMGSIIFVTKKGIIIHDDDGTAAIERLKKDLEKLFEDFPHITRHGILWDVLSGLEDYDQYHKNTGLCMSDQ